MNPIVLVDSWYYFYKTIYNNVYILDYDECI